jgi:hypothetical protein
MAASDDSSIRFMGSVADEPGGDLRFMKRRRVVRTDRNGDPLDGIVNLFDVALVLAVGFLVMALAGLGISGILTSEKVTIVTNPGEPDMQVVVKDGDQISTVDLTAGPEVAGLGTLLGAFYQLADGTVVYVPAGQLPPEDSAPTTPETTPTAPATVPTPVPSPLPTTGTTIFPTPAPQPEPGSLLTPAPRGGEVGPRD